MKKFVLFLFVLVFAAHAGVYAQDTVKQDTVKPEGYKFTDIKRLPATSVKDQFRAGTC